MYTGMSSGKGQGQGQVRSGQGGQGQGQDRSGQVRSGQVRSGQGQGQGQRSRLSSTIKRILSIYYQPHFLSLFLSEKSGIYTTFPLD